VLVNVFVNPMLGTPADSRGATHQVTLLRFTFFCVCYTLIKLTRTVKGGGQSFLNLNVSPGDFIQCIIWIHLLLGGYDIFCF
jgi:hypothetical protein